MRKKGQEDTILIQEILDGNPRAQEILYEKYTKSVNNFLKEKYTSYNDFDDDVAEIMIKVFMKLESFDSKKSKFRSWIYSIAKNHMIDKWRSNTITLTGNSTVLSVDANMGIDISGYITSTSTGTIASNQSTFTTSNCCAGMEFENCSSINFITNQITPEDYTLLDMKYVQGYDYNEIGKEFNVTSSTISNRVNYIKSKLKKNNPEIIYE
jgi:RNA polymerase sigma factor (sigma-70 family)